MLAAEDAHFQSKAQARAHAADQADAAIDELPWFDGGGGGGD